MRILDLRLQPVTGLSLSVPRLQSKIRELERITSHLSGKGTIDTPDKIDELRQKVRDGFRAGESFEAYTSVPRRNSLLLSLYLMDLGSQETQVLLPAFDENVATSILGGLKQSLKKHLRTQATQLYFTHFEKRRIPALEWLADRLGASWRLGKEDRLLDEASKPYHEHADVLFVEDAPAKVARERIFGESVDDLAYRFGVTPGGEFRERLLEEVILERLREASEDGIDDELDNLVLEEKERRIQSGYPLGAEAVKIMVIRSIFHFQGKVPPAWKEQLVRYACDPRVPNSAEQALWWGWANQEQKDVAIRALTELTLRKFIALLEESLIGTAAETQFERRAGLLLKLFDLGKVIDARLIVPGNIFYSLPPNLRKALMLCQTGGNTSFICLKCADEIYLTEGTHNFALRGFLGADRFPVINLWQSATGSEFRDSEFRVPERICDIFQRHYGDWEWNFVNQFPQHIEWQGLF